ncbi:MAG: hypothetical protein HYR63_01710 [Proteobacteria bacterium]|nr:hypothetical protein [Pseudomonadota bacterium]
MVLALLVVVYALTSRPTTGGLSPPGRIAASQSSASPALTPDERSQIILGWAGSDGTQYRAAVDGARYREFVALERRREEEDYQRLSVRARDRVHAALVPIFEEIEARVPEFGAWTFDWWTSWILLGHSIRWVWDELARGSIFRMPDRVQARLVGEIEQKFDSLVLQPDLIEPKLAQAIERSLAAARADLGAVCARHRDAVRAFVREATRQVERADGTGGRVTITSADGAASLTLPCGADGQREEAMVRAEILKLRESLHVDDPVSGVILRMSRPFATKLISYVVLPVLVTAAIGGIALPLLGILPNVLSGVIAGILTGAFGAAIIGFSASASVDWLLNRADERRNRGSFEVQVRRAVIASRETLDSGITEIQRQFIQNQLRAFMEAPIAPAPP